MISENNSDQSDDNNHHNRISHNISSINYYIRDPAETHDEHEHDDDDDDNDDDEVDRCRNNVTDAQQVALIENHEAAGSQESEIELNRRSLQLRMLQFLNFWGCCTTTLH